VPGDSLSLEALCELVRSPLRPTRTSPGQQPYLILKLDDNGDALSADECAAVVRWSQRQPCPVIAIGLELREELRPAVDVIVADAVAAESVLNNIRRSPLAAMMLVQVLRMTQHLPIEQALTAESLAYSALQGGPEFRRWLAQRPPRASNHIEKTRSSIVLERDAGVLKIQLNRPERRNALSAQMRDELFAALEVVACDPSIRIARLSGAGECFSAGGDLDEFGTTPDSATAHWIRSVQLPARLLAECADRLEFRLHGACIGAGIEMPAFARRVAATRDAFFELPELRFGLIPGAGGCVSIPRRIGRHNTAWLALSGERIDARQALAWGLVDSIVN